MTAISRDSAHWAWQLGQSCRGSSAPADKLCVFDPGSQHARWWMLGYRGEPFLWGES